MPNIKSQIKRVKTNEKSNAKNRAVKTGLKTVIKKTDAAIAAGTEADKAVSTAFSAIDKAAKTSALHKNTANRRKAAVAKKAAAAK